MIDYEKNSNIFKEIFTLSNNINNIFSKISNKCSAFFNEASNQDNMPPQASNADFWHQTVKIAKSLHADSANIEESIALKDLIVAYLCIVGRRLVKFVQFPKW